MRELLGVGAMGSVWTAEMMALKREVVVKFHEEGFEANESEVALKRFIREARILASVRHRNVAELYEVGKAESGEPYLIMERLTGRTLAARMNVERVFKEDDAYEVTLATLAGLRAVHDAGVLHRDVKPENIYLHDDGREVVPKLIDFGLAHGGDQLDRLTRGNKTVGTPGYMAPEQARGTHELDPRTDIYAVGVCLFEMLAGELPVEGQTGIDLMIHAATEDPIPLTSFRRDLAGAVSDVVMKALARSRDDRYRDAREMIAAVRTLTKSKIPRGRLPPKK